MFDHRSAFTFTVVNKNNQGETSMNPKWIALLESGNSEAHENAIR